MTDPRPTSAPRLCECGHDWDMHRAGIGCMAAKPRDVTEGCPCLQYRPTPLPPAPSEPTRENAEAISAATQVRMCLGFLKSVIRSGEEWSAECESEFEKAKEYVGVLQSLAAAPSPGAPDLAALRDAANRLRENFRYLRPGGCKKLSLGDACICPLCDIDRLTEARDAAVRERDALREAAEERAA